VYGATEHVHEGEMRLLPRIRMGPIEVAEVYATFGDFHVFNVWGLTEQPALLIGMDLLGTLDRLLIDYRRGEVGMLNEAIARGDGSIGVRTGAGGSRLPER
jgi:hypothetical protein